MHYHEQQRINIKQQQRKTPASGESTDIKATNVFSQTPENILADVVSLLEEIEFEENTEIFKEGDIGDAMYIIHRGNVRITKGKVILAILKENDVFGELSLLDAETRSASAFANTDCTILKLSNRPFMN